MTKDTFSFVGPPATMDLEALAQLILFREGIDQLMIENEPIETFEGGEILIKTTKKMYADKKCILFDESKTLNRRIKEAKIKLNLK